MNSSDPLPIDPQTLPATALVADTVTSVEMTLLLVAGRRYALAIQTGLDMARAQIIHQSAA